MNIKTVIVGEEKVDQSKLKPRTKEFIQYQCPSDNQVYYRMSIIDFLQSYTKRKQLETKYLTVRHKKVDPTTFSCVEPKIYGDRFHNFMS